MKKKRVAVGLSGGVDSSVAAALLLEQGYEVLGVTMAIYDSSLNLPQTGGNACLGPDEEEEIAMASAVAKQLNIPYNVVDLRKEYSETVLKYFKSEYLAGRTPNPCVVCNSKMKFGFLIERFAEAGFDFDYFATGHYARIVDGVNGRELHQSIDLKKDQTYFIHRIERSLLDRLIFPLGDIDKSKVWEIAKRYNLPTKETPESQDFISGDYGMLFKKNEITPGEIVDEGGKVLGEHRGIIYYTVGQRKGLGLSHPVPLYVKKIDAKSNRVIVTERSSLLNGGLRASSLSLLCDDIPEDRLLQVRIRRTSDPIDAKVKRSGDSIEVTFEHPQLSVTLGQSIVIYEGSRVIGGAVIDEALSIDILDGII